MRRRHLLTGTAALSLMASFRVLAAGVAERLIGGRKVQAAGITMDIPRIAETGNSVPITVSVDSPMTADDHVKKIHILVPGNPEKKAASYTLTSYAGKAEISTRIRLAKTQTVRAIAEMADGSVRGTGTNVIVTVGACVEEMWTD